MFLILPVLSTLAASVLALEHGETYAQTMGELTMLYPEARQWAEATELTAPCGLNAAIGNRTIFPLDDGFVALVAKEQVTEIRLRILYKSNPTQQLDFDEWYRGNVLDHLDIGHTCFHMPDQPLSVNDGDVATIQVTYMYDEDDEGNVAHYACSDIKFVEESVFDVLEYAILCFNATDNNYYSVDLAADKTTTKATTTVTASATSARATTTGATSATSLTSAGSGALARIAGPVAAFALLLL